MEVKCPRLQNLMEHVFRPSSNGFAEWVVAHDGDQLSGPMVEAELCVRYSLVYSCEDFIKMAKGSKELIRAAKSNSKYSTFKFRK